MCEALLKLKNDAIAEGMAAGIRDGKREMALSILEHKLPISLNVISEVTGIPIAELTKLAQQLKTDDQSA